MTSHLIVGVDLGHTHLRVALVRDGEILEMRRSKTISSGDWTDTASQVAEEVLSISSGRSIQGVGVGVAGQCSFKGVVRRGPNFWWPEAPLRQYLQDRFRLPVAVMNDTRAATFGEWKHGAGRGCSDLVCLFIGTGLGGGVVSGGRLLSGCSNTAGELGHIIVSMDGPECGCGNKGCLESIVSGLGIARRAREEAAKDPDAAEALIGLAGDASMISAGHVAEAAAKGDNLAAKIVRETAEVFSIGVVSLVHAFNPRKVIIGGGVAAGIPELIEVPKVRVSKLAMGCTCEQLEIVRSDLGDSAGPIGAASLLDESIGARKDWP